MKIKEQNYENYGRCLNISNGILEAIVTVECGPRIVRFGFCGGKNHFYNDLSRSHVTRSAALDEYYGLGAAFFYYGGHRVWMAPKRIPQTTYPDNAPLVYSIKPSSVSFRPALQKRNGIQVEMELYMGDGAADIMVVHSAENHLKERQRLALWAITMVAPGGVAILPQNGGEPNALAPNRTLCLWPGVSLRDTRFYAGESLLTFQHKEGNATPFQIATNNTQGWAAYVSGEETLVKRYIHTTNAPYPDNNCSFQLHANADYLELKSASPLYTIEPGEAIRHVENLSLHQNSRKFSPENEEETRYFLSDIL